MRQASFLALFLLAFLKLSFQKRLSGTEISRQVSNWAVNNSSDPLRILQSCQPGCLDCPSSPDQCLDCDTEMTLSGDVCICNRVGKYFETVSECTGDCIEGCAKCLNSQECLLCAESRTLNNGKCKCKPPRILIGTSCASPAYMIENSTTLNCEFLDQIEVMYQSTVSPLFDAVLQAQINPMMKYQLFPMIFWSGNCTFQNADTRLDFQAYLLNQATDILFIPSTFLDFNLQCDIIASYVNENGLEISKQVHFQTLSSSQPQVHISGGSFQMLTHTEENFILAEVSSKTGSQIPSSSLKVTWNQTAGDDLLDMTKLYSSSNPLKLTIPKCTLSQGKLYTFKISVKVGTSTTSQEVTVGVFSPKIQLQPLQTSSYHISTDDLILTASQFSIGDECNQGVLPSDFLDLSTIKYTWESVAIDLELTNDRLLLLTESVEIADDPNVSVPSDPLNLFYHSTNTPTLTIPSSYFTPLHQNAQLIFYLTATVQSISSSLNLLQPALHSITTKAYVQIVTSKPFIDLSFQCIAENNCEALTNNYYLVTRFTSSNFNPQFSYAWNINVFDPLSGAYAYYGTFSTFLSISQIDPGVPPIGLRFIPQILLTASDGTNTTSAFYTLPINPNPQNGTVLVYPLEGEAYKTIFFISTYGWVDDDLPITYQFFTYSTDGGFNNMLSTFQPFDFTPLLPVPIEYRFWSVGVSVTDNLGGQTSDAQITPIVTGGPQSWSELIGRHNMELSLSKSSMNILQRFRLISVILENLQAWELNLPDEGYYVASSQFKYLTITEMINIFLDLNAKAEMKLIMLQNLLYCTQHFFNQDRNWKLYMAILDSYYQANDSTSILTQKEVEIFWQFIDRLIYYMKKPGNSIEDPNKVYDYINTLIRSALSRQFPSDDSSVYSGDFFTSQTVKTTYCKVLEEGVTGIFYSTGGLRVNFTLKPDKTLEPQQCNNQLDFVFLAFRPDYIVEGWKEFKTIVYVDLRDPITGKSVLIDLFDYFLISPDGICLQDYWCVPNDGGTAIYGIFDLKDQIFKIFTKSNIDQLGNFYVLRNFKFWKSVAFWAVLGVSLWFLLSFYWLYAKHPAYCALQANRDINQKSLFKKINLFFWLVHPLIGIYIYNDSKITKPTLLVIYYQSLIVVMVFSTIFSSIEKGEGYVFKGYIILFNTLTVTPINAVLGRAFEWISKMKNPHKKMGPRIKFFLAFLVYLGILAASFVIMFVIEAQQDQSQNVSWAINFMISFIQDFTLSPSIGVTNKILLLRFAQNSFIQNGKVIKQILAFIIPDSFKSIYESIFIVAPVLAPVTPTLPTTIPDPLLTSPMSPPSSSRRLLKFGTLETITPTKSHVPYDFRSRRASESEMNTADIMAMETLMSNRFQTLFSEAKPESVKAFSPIMKENFSKMQSSNLYSNRSNPKLTSRTSRTHDKKFLNMTSIIMSPKYADAALSPEEDIISLNESPRDTYAPRPKLWSPNQTLKSFKLKQEK